MPPPEPTFDPQIDRAHVVAAGLGDDAFARRAAPDSWSVAEQLDHLTQVASRLVPMVDTALAENAVADERPFRARLVERFFVRMAGANPPIPVPVPPLYEPKPTGRREDDLAAFVAAHRALGARFEQASQSGRLCVVVTSPAMASLRLRLGAWVLAMNAHVDYHLTRAEAARRRVLY
jgi:hypothetical protein